MSYSNLSIYDWNLIANLEYNVTFFGSKKYDYKTIDGEINLIYTYNFFSNRLIKLVLYILNSLKLSFYIFKQKPSIVHFQWFKFPYFDFLLLLLIKILNSKIKIVFTAHNLLPHNSGNKYYCIYKRIYKSVDHTIVHTINSKKTLIKKFNISSNKISVIKHGLLDIIYDKKEVASILNSLQKTYNLKNKIVCLSIGKIHYYKGTDILIKAWESISLLHQNDNLRLLIAGQGDSNLILNSSKNIIIDNHFISNEKFVSYIKLADLIVLPYRQIAQSGVLLTILNFRKPVLVSKINGLIEPFLYGNIGWILDELSADNLASTLVKILSNKNMLASIQNDNELWGKVLSSFSWEEIGKLTSQVYKSQFSNLSIK